MSEQSKKNEAGTGMPAATKTNASDFSRIVVEVGYDDEARKVRFLGAEIAERSNKSHQGPNSNRWHVWTLYELPDNKYRVLDQYYTCWQGESGHNTLSATMDAKETVRKYPRFSGDLGDEAIEDVDEAGEVDGSPEQPDEE